MKAENMAMCVVLCKCSANTVKRLVLRVNK